MAIDERCDPTPDHEAERNRDRSRSRRHRSVRAQTISVRRLTRRELEVGRALYPADEHADIARPQTRADCKDGFRPCPFVSCKHHLYLDVNENGSIKLNFPDIDADELEKMPATCALDVAEKQGETLEEVGRLMNMTRERVRQLETSGVAKAKAEYERQHLRELDAGEHPQRRHLPIVEQPHEKMEWGLREDFDIDRFISPKLDE